MNIPVIFPNRSRKVEILADISWKFYNFENHSKSRLYFIGHLRSVVSLSESLIQMGFTHLKWKGFENINETITESSNYESLNLKKVRVNSVADIKSISILQPVSVVALSELAIIEWNGANSDLVEHYELELYPEHGSIEYSKRNQMNKF